MRNFSSPIKMLGMGIALAALSLGGYPAHAGPGEVDNGKHVGTMGTVSDRVKLNTKRAEAAKRQKERRAAAATKAAKKAEATKNAEGGAK